jgi:hypothetical protein
MGTLSLVFMSMAKVSWYIAGLLLAALGITSLVDMAPGHEAMQTREMAIFGTGSGVFAAVAVLFSTWLRSHWIHQSKLASRLYLAFAAVLTVVLFAVVVG